MPERAGADRRCTGVRRRESGGAGQRKDATGNTVTGAQLLTVDTQPPTLAINTIAQDNIVSAAEHNAALVLSGTSNAEAGKP